MQQPDEVDLISWPDGPNGGPRLLGRTDDPSVVAYVRDYLVRERRAEVARLAREGEGPHLRSVRPEDDDDPTSDGGGE